MFGKNKNKGNREPGPPPGPPEQRMEPPTYRSVSKWFIILSVLYILLGMTMIFWPNITLDLLGIVMGIFLLGYGAARIIIYFTKNHFDAIMHMDLTVGVVFGALGAFMLFHRDFVSTVFPFAVAILLLIGAISKLQYSLDMKHLGVVHYRVYLVFAIIMFVLGILLIYNPFKEKAMLWFIGATLILEGVLNCIAVLIISGRIRRHGRGSFEVTEESTASAIRSSLQGGMQTSTSMADNGRKQLTQQANKTAGELTDSRK